MLGIVIKGAEARAADAGGGVDRLLQQGGQVERAGQGGARVVEQFEYPRFIAQRFFHMLDFIDIGTGAEPAQQLFAAAHRIGAREKPAVPAVAATDRELHFKRRTSVQGRFPALQHLRQEMRVVGRIPAVAGHLVGRGAGIVMPALVVPGHGAVEIGDPGQLRNRVGQRAQVFFALAQAVFGRLALADIVDMGGQAIGAGKDAHFQPAPQRRMEQFETAALLQRHGAPVLRFQFRAQHVGAGLPQVAAGQGGAPGVLRRQHFGATRIDIADVPVGIEHAEAIGDAFEYRGDAGIRQAQRYRGRRRLLLEVMLNHRKSCVPGRHARPRTLWGRRGGLPSLSSWNGS